LSPTSLPPPPQHSSESHERSDRPVGDPGQQGPGELTPRLYFIVAREAPMAVVFRRVQRNRSRHSGSLLNHTSGILATIAPRSATTLDGVSSQISRGFGLLGAQVAARNGSREVLWGERPTFLKLKNPGDVKAG